MNTPYATSAISLKQEALTYFILLVTSSCLSLFLFMRNPWLASDIHSDSYLWFVEFSRTVFQPQSAYYAESILLPLMAKLIGANKTLLAYKLLCGLLTISILPITALAAQRYFQNALKTILFIVLFSASFQYLQYYILGFPDPLTILFLVLAVFQRRLVVMFVLLVLAMLSHFSMAALSVIGLIGLVYFSPNPISQRSKKMIGILMAAIFVGKLLLLTWFYLFHYQLQSRLDWALTKGYAFFLERYEVNVIGFWLTPGGFFLALYALIGVCFLIQKRYAFVLASIFALAIAYVALFWTVDGLRVFSVVIAAPFAYLLLSFIDTLSIGKLTK